MVYEKDIKDILLEYLDENKDYCWRKDHLLRTEAKTKFISFEPLLESVENCSLQDIDWVIAGG